MAGLLTPAAAADALADALRSGLDPEGCPQRTTLDVPGGQLLLMPAATGAYAGVKIAGVAPGNAALGLPRITGSYLLLDGPTLRPLALLDGAALTTLRTPAVSALALRHLAPAGRPLRLVLFGSGPQAYGHLEAVAAVRRLASVVVVARGGEGAEKLAAHARGMGIEARVGAAGDVADADLVVCCTTAREPLFDGRLVAPGATVVAVGSHEPDARETDTALVRRSAVYVESRAAALREAGDLLVPEAEGAIGPGHINGTLADLVAGRMPAGGPPGCPQLFKSVGMAWEDLAVAVALFKAAGASSET
ncbi:ornithine cyclodeaminase family protein [Streptomyces sp. NPDC012746]|nr:ornithine cyclodeaminase family protein [Streptomyces sp. NBC_01551]MCX4540753.1 ornithine cyclodeaminase family protein [Streptomyces sp. NBC_01565]